MHASGVLVTNYNVQARHASGARTVYVIAEDYCLRRGVFPRHPLKRIDLVRLALSE
jgi:hypothetical protein